MIMPGTQPQSSGGGKKQRVLNNTKETEPTGFCSVMG